ncbi:hypothetical protein HPB51_012782 [Rhipicephalus microplus]|uniref:Tick transposon n=1 Tax=Rhipicephalus microplus TaxID=6941 RepID=A0A9J6DMY7_RHIMP|nr:hypothetical protein HPB51_012782 [Rhipicephalus microplus]
MSCTVIPLFGRGAADTPPADSTGLIFRMLRDVCLRPSTERWLTSAAKKRSLQSHLKYKLAPDCEPFYWSDRESTLLFQTRTGSLTTQQRRWELFNADPSCRLCGAMEETIQHTIMDCPRLGAREHPKLSLAEYLGLSDDSVDIQVEHTESAKQRLKLWDRLCWQVDKHPDGVQRNNDATEPLHDTDATG